MNYEFSVCVNDICERDFAVKAALNFSTQNDAHLTAIYIKLDEVQIERWVGSSPYEFTNHIIIDQEKQERHAKALFKSLAKSYNCKTTWKTFNQSDNPFNKIMCTDYIFAAQPVNDEFTHRPDDHFLTNLLLQTKRPIILIPNGWEKTHIGEKVLIGWNDSTIAMRAVADAMPLLANAKEVKILEILKQHWVGHSPNNHPQIGAYLNGKGVANTLSIEGLDKGMDKHQKIINFAKKQECDLIVIGGYGHSRLREVYFGGVTKHLLTQSSVPVLVSH